MDPLSDPAATAASVAASVVAGSPNNQGLSDDAAAFSLTLSNNKGESPDVAFDRLVKVHQGAGLQQECQVCRRLFPNWYKLKQHLHTHADFKPYACNYCDKTFRNFSKKSRHEKTHSGIKPYVCKICDKHVSRSEHLKRHLLTHTESHPFKCMQCEYRSRRLDCIRYHMKNKHPEKDTKIYLNQSIVDAEDDHPNDASDILWQQYKDSPETLALVAVRSPEDSGPKPKKRKKKKSSSESASFPFAENKMPDYPASTTNMLGQQMNLAQFPSNMPPSMIPGFTGFTTLNQIKNEHPHPPVTPPHSQANSSQHNQVQVSVSSNGEQQQLTHKMLQANFNNSNENGTNRSKFFLNQVTQPTLLTQPQTQRNDMPLPKNMCAICEKAFDCPSKLVRHQNTHSGIRPYKCNVCGKALSRPEHLKRHVLTHSADKKPAGSPFGGGNSSGGGSKKSKSKSGGSKSTVSSSAHAMLAQAQAQVLQQQQQQQQQNPDATVVVSRVKQEGEEGSQQRQQQQQQQVLTCQVVQQKTPPLTVVATPTLHPDDRNAQQQHQQYIMATSQQQHLQQQHPLIQVGPGGNLPWTQVASSQGLTLNATAAGIPMTGLRGGEQLTAYPPGHPAAGMILHGYALGAVPVPMSIAATTSSSSSSGATTTTGSSASSDSHHQTPVMLYQRTTAIPSNLVVNASAANATVCAGPPVFPPIS